MRKMKHVFLMIAIYSSASIIYAQDYPWKNIAYIRINIQLNDIGGFPPAHDYCTCNCDSNSIGCQYTTFNFSSWDKDTCFWINLFNSSKPEYKTTGISGMGYGCGPPARSIKIELETTRSELMTLYISDSRSKELRMFIKDKNGKWDFTLSDNQLSLLNKKIDSLIKCGINDLQNKYNKSDCGCK
jgi:hypothetical protein